MERQMEMVFDGPALHVEDNVVVGDGDTATPSKVPEKQQCPAPKSASESSSQTGQIETRLVHGHCACEPSKNEKYRLVKVKREVEGDYDLLEGAGRLECSKCGEQIDISSDRSHSTGRTLPIGYALSTGDDGNIANSQDLAGTGQSPVKRAGDIGTKPEPIKRARKVGDHGDAVDAESFHTALPIGYASSTGAKGSGSP